MRPRSLHIVWSGLVVLGICAGARAQSGPGGVESLLALVPDDATAVLAAEHLRVHLDAWKSHPGMAAAVKLSAVQRWLASADFERLRAARVEIESVLGVSIGSLIDDLLGEAVVLSLHASGEGGSEPKGLLLLRPRDPQRLARLIEAVDAAERRSGALKQTGEHRHRGEAYRSRRFNDPRRAPDFYATLAGNGFAWSNSEALLRAVIDRGLDRTPVLPWIAELRAQLPAGAIASVYAGASALELVARGAELANKVATDSNKDPALSVLQALRGVAVSLHIGASVELHCVELVDLERVGGSLPALARAPRPGPRLVQRLRGPLLLVASGDVDFEALYRTGLNLALAGDPERRMLFETFFGGLVGGPDAIPAVLGGMGPEVLLAWFGGVAAPPSRPSFLGAVELRGPSEVHERLANLVRTTLALVALDSKRTPAGRLETLERDGLSLLRYRQAGLTLVAHVGPGLLVLGSEEERVVDFARGGVAADGASSGAPWQVGTYADADHLVWLDHEPLRAWIEAHRGELIARIRGESERDPGDAEAELDQSLQWLGLFDATHFVNEFREGGRIWAQTLGLDWKSELRGPSPARGAGP